MDWTKFNNHGESSNHAFEVMCNILFKYWFKKEYKDNISHFAFINGSGGDGGVEAYGLLTSGDVIGVQSKWFPQKMEASQFTQIENSFYTAIKVRPKLKRYIVCVPRDFTSKRMVKNNQVAKDTEESKWINLCEKINKEYPDVVIELWDETSIQEKLCLPETQGCYKYWFECSDVFETEILTSYQRAINSWAKPKYIPDLYSMGYIHDKLSCFISSFEATKKKYDMTQNIYAIVQKLKRAYEDILRLKFTENEKVLLEKIKSDISILGEWLCIIREIGSLVASGSDIERDNFEKKFELNCDSSELKDSSLHFSYYTHFYEVESILDNIEDDFEQFKRCVISDSHNKIIFLGNQGTGKTAGIVSEINLMLQGKTYLPILVQAKDYSYIETSGFYTPQEICAVQTAKETNDIINIGEQENNVQVYKLITTCLSAHNEDTEMSFYLPSGIARKITGITYGDGYEYINENNEVIYKFSDVDKDWKNQQVCLQVNTSILESALKENSYKLFWVFRVYRSPSNKAYELYGNQICHDTDRSFVVWFDEEECKYIELKEIKPIRPNTYDDYELNIKILYGDAED